MRYLKTAGFVVACTLPLAVLLAVSVMNRDKPSSPPPSSNAQTGPAPSKVEAPATNVPAVANAEVPDDAQLSWLRDSDGHVMNADDVGHVEHGADSPVQLGSDPYRYGDSGGMGMSYNPELRRMGLHIGKDGIPHYGTPENPGTEAGWEVLKRKQQGENTGGK